jgi:hypothetical protein
MRWPRIVCWLILLALPAGAQREQFQNADVMPHQFMATAEGLTLCSL